jgi:hypothetical protein
VSNLGHWCQFLKLIGESEKVVRKLKCGAGASATREPERGRQRIAMQDHPAEVRYDWGKDNDANCHRKELKGCDVKVENRLYGE